MDKQAWQPHLVQEMMRATPARIGVSRAGTRPPTAAWLRFRHDHALAKDAVHSQLSDQFLDRFARPRNFPIIQSTADSRADYVLFPPKGKRATGATIESLKSTCPTGRDVQIIISDGLSARAIEANAADV
jgi:ethanolamine ammonia-lyase small subunit